MKLTTRQAEVMANLSSITTDGVRYDPMFWLGEKNVTVQVRKLLTEGLVELCGTSLIKTKDPAVFKHKPSVSDTKAAVNDIRAFLSNAAGR